MRHVIIALTAFVFFASCKSKQEAPKNADTYYTCSMDPQVIAYKPGKCPICHMELTKVKKTNGGNKDEIQLSEQQIQLGNIHTDTILNGTIGDQLVLTATLNFDQMKSSSVSSRVMGRVEKLYFKNLGDYIKKGSPLYDLYSEELNNAKQEYLLALERKKVFADEKNIDFAQLLQSAKNKLLLWGMSEMQVQNLAESKKATPTTTFYSTASGYITALDIREGEYTMEGGTIVKLADLSSLWAEAQVYTSQLSEIDRSSIATVQLPDFDGKEIKGSIEFKNVCFGYNHTLINDFNCNLSPGDFACVSTASGSGKTTLLNILLGFEEIQKGSIFFNSHLTNAQERQSYWGDIAYVKQQPFVLYDTIEKNITLDDGPPNEPLLNTVLSVTGIAEWLAECKEGLQTIITENGKNISGGQRQRIAIARALYKNANVIILDEPFSELDEISEIRLLQYFKSLAQEGKLILLVTHYC